MDNSRKSRLSEMLRKRPKDFAERERKVYDYLLKKENRIQELKVSDIADGAGVSKATVVRFCKTLGYDGLKDFKVGYEAGKSPVHYSASDLDFDTPYEEAGQHYLSVLSSVFHTSFNSVNQSELMHIADEMLSASLIRITSDSEASESAKHAYSVLKDYFPSIELVEGSELKKLTPSGFSLSFAFTSSENLSAYMKKASLLGFKCALFSSDNRNKLSSYASYSVTAQKTSGILQTHSLMSKLVIDAFINELYALIALKRGSSI